MTACGAADEQASAREQVSAGEPDQPAAAASSGAAAGSEVRSGGMVRFEDREVGLSVEYPEGWHRLRALTNVAVPRELIALATYPLRGGGEGGGPCAAERDLEAIPRDGALIWLFEYRPLRGEVWAELRRSSFPPRSARLNVSRDDLQPNSCLTGVGYAPRASGLVYTTTFSDANRPFQLSLVFGADVSDARIAEVERILASLELTELLPPPPDPYADWPLINDNPGDSLRPPPGWAAAAAMFPPAQTPRPRPLFFASNRPLVGLPARLVPHLDSLPGPFPGDAVANAFPRDGVLLWVLEEDKGAASGEFPRIGPGWPGASDFQPARPPLSGKVALRWLRAGGFWRGYRFSVWIASAPEATVEDRELALKSAASLAVSGCWRDATDDCPDR